MLFHSPSWPRFLYQSGWRQETDGTLKGVIEENFKMGALMKVRHSCSKKIGELLPAQAWKGQGRKILTGLVRAAGADVAGRSSEDQNLWPSVVQYCHFQSWSWQGGSPVGGKQPKVYILISLSFYPLVAFCFLSAKPHSSQRNWPVRHTELLSGGQPPGGWSRAFNTGVRLLVAAWRWATTTKYLVSVSLGWLFFLK